jgi:hypothetical protein
MPDETLIMRVLWEWLRAIFVRCPLARPSDYRCICFDQRGSISNRRSAAQVDVEACAA